MKACVLATFYDHLHNHRTPNEVTRDVLGGLFTLEISDKIALFYRILSMNATPPHRLGCVVIFIYHTCTCGPESYQHFPLEFFTLCPFLPSISHHFPLVPTSSQAKVYRFFRVVAINPVSSSSVGTVLAIQSLCMIHFHEGLCPSYIL